MAAKNLATGPKIYLLYQSTHQLPQLPYLFIFFVHKDGTGGERYFVIFEDKSIINHVNEKVSSRALH